MTKRESRLDEAGPDSSSADASLTAPPSATPAEDRSNWPDHLFTIQDGAAIVVTIDPRGIA